MSRGSSPFNDPGLRRQQYFNNIQQWHPLHDASHCSDEGEELKSDYHYYPFIIDTLKKSRRKNDRMSRHNSPTDRVIIISKTMKRPMIRERCRRSDGTCGRRTLWYSPPISLCVLLRLCILSGLSVTNTMAAFSSSSRATTTTTQHVSSRRSISFTTPSSPTTTSTSPLISNQRRYSQQPSSTRRSSPSSKDRLPRKTTTTNPFYSRLAEDIELASHGEDDKLLQTQDRIGGTINITSIEEGVDLETLQTNNNNNGFVQPFSEKEVEQAELLGIRLPPALSKMSTKKLWKRRYARSIEEGIRRETTTTAKATESLSTLLERADTSETRRKKGGRAARTIAGLIVALSEEAQGLEVEVDARRDTPMWGKHVDAVTINFSRLGFKPLQIGGLDQALRETTTTLPSTAKTSLYQSLSSASVRSTDEAFQKIDSDNSGAINENELTKALTMAMDVHHERDETDRRLAGLPLQGESSYLSTRKVSKEVLSKLAKKLVKLYDRDGDKSLDRNEYQSMVEDMAALHRAKKTKLKQNVRKLKTKVGGKLSSTKLDVVKKLVRGVVRFVTRRKMDVDVERDTRASVDGVEMEKSTLKVRNEGVVPLRSSMAASALQKGNGTVVEKDDAVVDVSEDDLLNSVGKGEGSIVLSDLKLDLRRLLFGALPWVKKITPGGPLILEPFTMTVTGSFNADDILNSFLIDAGLRRLVARTLVRRVRSFRDLVDGAVFFGRTWNMASKAAPVVEVPRITSIEFDTKDRVIISGVARVKTSPGSPFIENAFKLRTKIGTRKGGRFIRLDEPELALVIECPKAWERNIVSVCNKLNLPVPTRPTPIYSYIPLISPLKTTKKDGFDLGEDNQIKSIYIKDGALRFEMCAVLRPGRFLGNHYIAFTIPNRTFIITMDRVREGIRVARRNKKAAKEAAKEAVASEAPLPIETAEETELRFKDENDNYSKANGYRINERDGGGGATSEEIGETNNNNDQQSFFGRFVRGYLRANKEDRDEELNARLTSAISEWFGRQDSSDEEERKDDDQDEEQKGDDDKNEEERVEQRNVQRDEDKQEQREESERKKQRNNSL